MKMNKVFTTSVRCPICGEATHMTISSDPEYAYYCARCVEDYYPIDIIYPETQYVKLNDNGEYVPVWEITLHGKSSAWYSDNKDKLDDICSKYNISGVNCNGFDPDDALITFTWGDRPTTNQIHNFAKDVVNIYDKQITLINRVRNEIKMKWNEPVTRGSEYYQALCDVLKIIDTCESNM